MLADTQLNKLESHFPQLKFERNYPLSLITYFKVGGPARSLVKVDSLKDLVELIRHCHQSQIRFVLLGGASNVVVADEGIDGLVIVTTNDRVLLTSKENENGLLDNEQSSFQYKQEKSTQNIVRAECGARTAMLVNKSIEFGLTGLEPFMGVPGKVGGAIFNNSHFQDELIGDFIARVEVLNKKGERVWLNQAECQFDYDHSRFQTSGEVILQADFLLVHGEKEESRRRARELMNYRAQTQPLGVPSSGCIFKNVKNTPQLQTLFPQFADKQYVSAGFLIDQAGLKGLREGDIEVSSKHASFMINVGTGSATDIQKLVEKVKLKVEKQFGVTLQEEIFWIK
jgi:UDP-N-acetylmuramate dehydrogenase